MSSAAFCLTIRASTPATSSFSIEEKTVTLEKTDDHSTVVLPADSVVLALGVRPRSALAESFESCCPQVHIVGDARKGGRIATAVREGFEAAYVFEA